MSWLAPEVEKKLYKLALYALLHDVGKPILRFARRYIQGVEVGPVADLARNIVEETLNINIDVVSSKKHVEISNVVINRILGVAPSPEDEKYINYVIGSSDKLAASERGLISEEHSFIQHVQNAIEEEVTKRAGLATQYSHEHTPMLIPTWLLLETAYLNHIGLKAYASNVAGIWSGSEERRRIAETIFFPLHNAINARNEEKLKQRLVEMLCSLADEELWISVKPLLPRTAIELKASKLGDAMKQGSYSSIVSLLLYMLNNARRVYRAVEGYVTRGFIDTVNNILKITTFFVPSAIYWSLVPDISLYSHSKLVATYTIASQLGQGQRLRIVVIDGNNIQRFIAASVNAAAASRVMRGRSILVELALDALTEYTLELFGKLSSTNVVVSEGGTIDIIVPDTSVFTERISILRKVGFELSQYLGGIIGFTVAYSDPFRLEDVSFERTVKAIAEDNSREGFVRVLDTLAQNLAMEKAKTGCKPEIAKVKGIIAKEDDIQTFDALTQEPVLVKADLDSFKLIVEDKSIDYVNLISGEKLSIGNVISTPTHMSLAIGTVSRELIAMLSIHVYKLEQGFAKPDAEAIEIIRSELLKQCKEVGPLLCIAKEYETKIALVPLNPVGALYLLIASPIPMEILDVESHNLMKELYSTVYEAIRSLLQAVSNTLTELSNEGRDVKIWIRLVNAPHMFIFTEALRDIYGLDEETLKELSNKFNSMSREITNLISRGVDVALGFVFMGLYHPAIVTRDAKGIKGIKLIDLDNFGIIAMAKMDIDMFGEVRALYTVSPSRLVTLSDFVNIVVASKAYLKAVSIAHELKRSGRNIDVIPLYAGGDDITVYGKWSHIVYYMYELYSDVRSVLKPLALSLAIAIADATEPLFLLHRHAVELLENYTKSIKAACVIGLPYTILYPWHEQTQNEKWIICNAMPFETSSKFYPWIDNRAANWNLSLLSKILNVVDYVSDRSLLSEFEKYKRELYILATIAHEYSKAIESTQHLNRTEYLSKVIPIEILYAYVWSRRGKELKKLKDFMERIDGANLERILAYPDDIVEKTAVEEALRLLLAAKPVIDFIILALRRLDAVEPSKLIQEV